MLPKPKFTKYSKAQKGRIRYIVNNNQQISFGSHALVAKQPARIKASVIAAAILAMKRKLKREGVVYLRIFPHIPVSSKPAEVRMGKGKGNISHWVARVRSGTILFEIKATNPNISIITLELAGDKFPIRTTVISKQ